MLQLFLWTIIPKQVILTCKRQTDCLIGNYCNINKLCYSCSYITRSLCDSINGCCSQSFIDQCSDNPYPCNSKIRKLNSTTQTNNLHIFLYGFIIISTTYLAVGSYCNKYIHKKKGCDILPNKRMWLNIFGLVKDGISYSYIIIHRYISNKYNGEQNYNSL